MLEMTGILYESNQLLVVQKPGGMITEDNPFEKDNLEFLCGEYLKQKINAPYLGVVHRLDRVTSGLVVFAKKRGTLKTLNRWFEDRKIHKTYWAVTSEAPPKDADTLTHYLLVDKNSKKALVVDPKVKGAKKAELKYSVHSSNDHGYLLEIKPKTGRFHQIRAQLGHIGCPILGDRKYGSSINLDTTSIGLHAHSLRLPEAINNSPLKFEASLPETAPWNWFII